jgi:hypothetical protein
VTTERSESKENKQEADSVMIRSSGRTYAAQFPSNVSTFMVGLARKQFNNYTKVFSDHLHT